MSSEHVGNIKMYLTFTLGEEEFALEIQKVREVLDYTAITRVPRMPDFLRGVINLRGNVVPVIDLRLKLGMAAVQRTVNTCIVIVEVEMDGELIQVGALADSVKEVISLEPGEISAPPRLGTKLKTEFIQGMGRREDGFLIILDIDRVLSTDEISLVQGVAEDEVQSAKFSEEETGKAQSMV